MEHYININKGGLIIEIDLLEGIICCMLYPVEKLPESEKLADSASAAVYATPEIHPILTHVTASNKWCEVMQSV